MAKKAKVSAEEKAEKKKISAKERNSVIKNNYQTINEMDGVKTEVLHIREQGCIVRETSKVGVSSIFVPNVKPKKKGVNYVLIQDTPEQREKKKAQREAKKAAGGTKKKTKK